MNGFLSLTSVLSSGTVFLGVIEKVNEVCEELALIPDSWEVVSEV